jgi:hypothetical protein
VTTRRRTPLCSQRIQPIDDAVGEDIHGEPPLTVDDRVHFPPFSPGQNGYKVRVLELLVTASRLTRDLWIYRGEVLEGPSPWIRGSECTFRANDEGKVSHLKLFGRAAAAVTTTATAKSAAKTSTSTSRSGTGRWCCW